VTRTGAPGGRTREAERAELEQLRREMSETNKRIRELEMERCPQAMHGPLGEVTESAPAALAAFIGNQRTEHGHHLSAGVASWNRAAESLVGRRQAGGLFR